MATEEYDHYSDDLEGDEGFVTDVSDDEHGDGSDDYDEANAPDKEEIRDAARDLCMQIGQYEYGEDTENQDEDKIHSCWKRGPRALGALRSLRKLWKLDDDDPTRKVARAFADNEVLDNFIVPALLESAGQGKEGDAIALACTDLLTAMTWPFDGVSEVSEQEKQGFDSDELREITKLDKHLIDYKSAILRTQSLDKQHDVLGVVMRYLLLPNLATKQHQRSSLVIGIIGMCLHLFRNLLAIRDPVVTSLGSVAQLSNANLQSKLVQAMKKHHILDTLLMLASSAETPLFNAWNAVASECIFHIFVGTKVKEIAGACSDHYSSTTIAGDTSTVAGTSRAAGSSRMLASTSRPSSALAESLATEAKMKRASNSGKLPTRHSRFGTTINFVGPDGERRVARNQAALVKSVARLADEAMHKGKRRARRRKNAQEMGAPKLKSDWTAEAAVVLQDWADTFVQAGFEPLAKSIIKDIRSEREKLGNLDVARIRIMQLGAYFLEYFLSRRAAAAARRKARATAAVTELAPTQATANLLEPQQQEVLMRQPEERLEETEEEWPFELVGQWLEPWAFKMVLIRTMQAHESKNWLEFVASVQLWIALLRLVDELASSKKEAERDVAEGLQAEFYYMSETLDACHAVVHCYTTQSFAFLDTLLTFAYVMPKMLERYASNRDHMYVQAKKHVRRSRQDGDLDATQDEARQIQEQLQGTRDERRFKFDDFQRKLATKQLAKACIDYLARWQDYTDTEGQLNKLVTVMHRIAVKANDYRQFFLGGHRAALRTVLSGDGIRVLETRAPTAAPNLKKLMDYILRKFSRLSPEEQSIYDTGKKPPRPPKPPRMPAEIAVRPGMTKGEEIGVAVGLLLKKEKMQAVLWVKSALEMASAMRTELVVRHEEEEAQRQAEGGDEAALLGELEKQNESVVERFQPYELAYHSNDELRLDASLLPELKLLCRLVGLEANDNELVHWRWSVPREILPAHLNEKVETMERFIREPIDTHGRELTALVMRVRKPRESGAAGEGGLLNAADLPDGWSGELSDSDEDADYFDRARAHHVVNDDQIAADGGLLRSSVKKRISKPTGSRGPKKQMRRTQKDFIYDSDEEFAFAIDNEGAPQRDDEADSSNDDAVDEDDDMVDEDTPPTSEMADNHELDEEDGKLSALEALRVAKQRTKKKETQTQMQQPLEYASDRIIRRVDSKRLFFADSDEYEDDILALPSQESVHADTSSGKLVKRRRLAILDDEDEDDD
ncbi:related to TOF1 - topoisomerase I interacting factor 1 [Melanopsichium pennsylvanicum]|uniref:Related to TOF1 - topoisomerase I interacting factor 1 n=1 Tax=Melanopsichium pennsylvanicum TaxID=63383 RepID=A0AAJ5C4P8_9BASI|nr:related to TOF1 - topoisomerase I interacting factor 1 [Melanopsichium pennsylvanicum]